MEKLRLLPRLAHTVSRPVVRKPRFQSTSWENNAQNYVEQFAAYGFTVVPGAFDQNEVGPLRRRLAQFFSTTGEAEMLPSQFLQIEELAHIPFKTRTVTVLKSILGEHYTTYPNFKVAQDLYTSWHTDNNFRPEFHETEAKFLNDPNFRHAQAILYLQDNSSTNGGGLDLVPHSHRWGFRLKNTYYAIPVPIRNVLNKIQKPLSLDTRPGDLILFDPRLLHRGTSAQTPPKYRKYSISWSASYTDAGQIYTFMSYYWRRLNYLKRSVSHDHPLLCYMRSKYTDILNIKFPDFYPDTIVRAVRQQGLNVAEFSVPD